MLVAMWPLSKLPSFRTARILQSRANLRATHNLRIIDAEIDALKKVLRENRNIRDLSKHPGYLEVEADMANWLATKLRRLPEKVHTDKEGALWDSACLEVGNRMLGLVSETLLESQLAQEQINTLLNAKQRLKGEG